MQDEKHDIPEEWVEVVRTLTEKVHEARAMGGPVKLEKRRQAGKLDARARVDLLVDAGSFTEIGVLVGGVETNGLPTAPADALVGGFAAIDGRPVIVGSEDATVQGGSIGFGTHAKRIRLAMLARREGVPLIMILDGAGERITNSMQRHPYAPNDLQALTALTHEIPTISVVAGASAGHGALTALLSDFVIMVEGAGIFSAGPPLVAQALGERVSIDELGGAAVHGASGVVHNIAASEEEAFALVHHYLSYMPSNHQEHAPRSTSSDTGDRLLHDIFNLIPRSIKRAYDIRPVIGHLVDDGAMLEFQPGFGQPMITTLARLGGQPIAIVANQPAVMAGAITREAAEKAAYFLDLANAYRFPVLFLADNPGVMSGRDAERVGTLRAAARMYAAQSRVRGPKLHVTLRKAFGFGSSLMAMNPFDDQTITLAFPGITLGGIPSAGGGKAAHLDPAQQALLDEIEREGWLKMADSMAYDEFIDPRELRNKLLAALRLSMKKGQQVSG